MERWVYPPERWFRRINKTSNPRTEQIKMIKRNTGRNQLFDARPVKYDGDTKTVYIGKLPVGDTYLSDIEPFDIQGHYFVDTYGPTEPFTMGGRRYSQKGVGFESLIGSSQVAYNLNGKYKTLTSKIGLNDSTIHRAEPATIQIYGDDENIFEFKAIPGELPKDVTIDLKSALRMKIVLRYDGSPAGYGSRVNLVNAVLHP